MAQHLNAEKQRHWLDLFRLWQQSKLSVRAFCERHQLSEPSFYSWRRTLQQRGLLVNQAADDAGHTQTPAFVQLSVAAGAAAVKTIDVILTKGRRLRIRPGFDANTLRQLLRVLEEPAC